MADAPTKSAVESDDPVLNAALAEMQDEGFSPSDPAPTSSQDEPRSSDGPDDQPAPNDGSDPVDTGDQELSADPSSEGAPTTTASSGDDPLAGAEPFTYTVNGESKVMDGVYRFPGEGLMIPEEQVPKWQLMASRADTLERANRDQYQRLQEYDRLSEWKTRGADGNEVVLNGRDALQAMRVSVGQLHAANQLLVQYVENPELLLSLVRYDDNNNIVSDKRALDYLTAQLRLASNDVERSTREQFASALTEASKPQAPDVQEVAPVIVQNYATQLGAATLTAEDKSFLISVLPQFVRTPTAADIQLDPALANEPLVVDPKFPELLQQLANKSKVAAQVAQTSATASKFNAAQQQARGKVKPATRPPTNGTPTTSPAAPDKKSRAQAWDDPLNSAMAEMGIT